MVLMLKKYIRVRCQEEQFQECLKLRLIQVMKEETTILRESWTILAGGDLEPGDRMYYLQ